MEDKIISIIKKENGKLTFKNLMHKVNISRDELGDLLLKLKLDGKILQKGNKYSLFPNDLCIGSITISSTGRKYIFYNDDKINVASNFLNDVILNDVVTFKINENNEAEIVSIVHRPLGKMTCEIKVIDGRKTVIPFHNNIAVRLDYNVLKDLDDGDIIVVDINPDNIDSIPEAKFIKKLGRIDDPLIDDIAIALNFGFDNNYSDEEMNEIYGYPTSVTEEDRKGRVDYRGQKSFTMDGADTKDMDDGLFAEMLDNNIIRVYVHIADVSHYIKPGSRLFERACQKTTSLYMNNSVFHMLHHIISNGICSLNEKEDRLAKTVVMDIDSDGNIINYDIQYSVINSKKKMTYEDVDEIIMHDNMVPGYEDFKKEIYLVYDAALRLEKRFAKNGKLNFANNELSVTYKEDGTIKSVKNRMNSIGMKIVENLMIAANETVANWFISMDMFTVFRIHEFPNLNKVNRVIDTLNKQGYNIEKIYDSSDSKSMQSILDKLSSFEEFPIISQMLVQTMQLARYSVENMGHYALGLPAYLHFTSPIRRLADLIVHTLIDLIFTESDKLTPEYLNKLENRVAELCVHASDMERQAEKAELIAERRQILKNLVISKDVEYEATVIEIYQNASVKIRLDGVETYIDGKYAKQVFGYDSKRNRYYDRDTGKHIKIGTKVWVRILSVDPTSDKFNAKLCGIVKDNTKKRILQPE